MNVFKKAFRATCKAAQATAKYGTRTVMTPVVGAGKLGQVALKGAAKVAEMAGWDRGSEALDDFGAAIDHGATMVSDCATAGVGIATGSVMAIASFATGQDDVADELGDSIREDIDSFRDNRDSFVDSGKRAMDNWVGKAQYDKVYADYESLRGENERTVAEISASRDCLTGKIDEAIESINRRKKDAKSLFDRFVVLSRKVAEWRVARYDTRDVFLSEPVKKAPLVSPEDLFASIDFDNDPIWSHFKGVFTMGILTVSQVNEVQGKVDAFRSAAKASWDQDRELNNKYSKLLDVLKFVADAFDLFVPLYSKLQDELDYALSTVEQIMAQRDMFFFADAAASVNPYFLPQRHVNVLMACDKLTRILCEMTKRHYLSVADGIPVAIDVDHEKVKSLRDHEFGEVEKLVAA